MQVSKTFSMNLFKSIFFILISLTLVLIMNGNVSFVKLPIPAPASFLDPFSGVWNNAEDPQSGTIHQRSVDLDIKAEIYFDERKVPHVFAPGIEETLFLIGYLHASERLFQMELTARATAGELSEILGIRTLELDKKAGRNGVKQATDKMLVEINKNPEWKALYMNYVNGVNHFIDKLKYKDYPIEYKLLNISPRKWTMEASVFIGTQMAVTLAGGSNDVSYSNVRALLGDSIFYHLYPEIGKSDQAVVPDLAQLIFDTIPKFEKDQDRDIIIPFYDQYYTQADKSIGSNSWAVAPMKTKNGMSILSNDPHLNLTLPSIWYEMHIVSADFNAYGVTIPGIPGMQIGFNDSLSWSSTNVGQDIKDYFLIEWEDENRKKYKLDDEWKEPVLEVRNIKVRGKKIYIDTVYQTFWGPVQMLSTDANHDLAMSWLPAHSSIGSELKVFIKNMGIRNYDEYLENTREFNFPAQNFIAADVHGNIGVRINGSLPLRGIEDGRFVKSGNNSSHHWGPVIPRDQNPQVKNPESGFVSSANQRSAPPEFPYYYTGSFEYYRNRDINQRLSSMENISVEDMIHMQTTNFSLFAKEALSEMLPHLEGVQSPHFNLLKSWNFEYNPSELAPVIFEIWFNKFQSLTFDELKAFENSVSLLYPNNWRLIEILEENPGDAIFDLQSTADRKENAKDILLISWQDAVMELDSLFIENAKITWGVYRPTDIMHIMQIPSFSVLSLPVGGSPDAINAVTKTNGPSWRMVVALKESGTEGYGIYPGGQSGNPLSSYYKNMIDDWMSGKVYKLNTDTDIESFRNSNKSYGKIIFN
jgi:penicillin G amidase